MRNGVCSIVLFVMWAVAGSAPAAAGPAAPGLNARDGLLLGVGVNLGEVSCRGELCEGVTEAGGVELHVGSMVGARAAVGIDLWAMAHTEDQFTLTHTIVTVGMRYWLLPRLWIQGGVGLAQGAWRYDARVIELEDQTEYVPAIMGAVGYELVIGRGFAMDLQLRGGTGYYDEDSTRASNVGVGLGFTWY